MKDIKNKILQEMIDLMDMNEKENLKKHPKLIAAEVKIEKPMGKQMGKPMDNAEMENEDEGDDSENELELENLDPELIKKLMKLAK